jgi:hypothetical protein
VAARCSQWDTNHKPTDNNRSSTAQLQGVQSTSNNSMAQWGCTWLLVLLRMCAYDAHLLL